MIESKFARPVRDLKRPDFKAIGDARVEAGLFWSSLKLEIINDDDFGVDQMEGFRGKLPFKYLPAEDVMIEVAVDGLKEAKRLREIGDFEFRVAKMAIKVLREMGLPIEEVE